MPKSGSERYVYGPVPSRRLGWSLGVDLVPFKTCDYNCVYCQLGTTEKLTCKRSRFAKASDILAELERKLHGIEKPDYITMSGSGEPTLNTELGRVIEGVRGLSDTPVAVLTNGSLLGLEDVASSCSTADLVVPSLDAGDERTFVQVNRPCGDLGFEKVADGIAGFSAGFDGEIWLEVFLVDGLNTSQGQLKDIAAIVSQINPDRVQLNTADRPPAETWVRPAAFGTLQEAARLIPGAEAVTDRSPEGDTGVILDRDEVVSLCSRRPCTIEDLAAATGAHRLSVVKTVGELVGEGVLRREIREGKSFYQSYFHSR